MSYVEIDLTKTGTLAEINKTIDIGLEQLAKNKTLKTNIGFRKVKTIKPPIVETENNVRGLRFEFGKKKDKSRFLKEFPKASDLGIHGAFLPYEEHKAFTNNKPNGTMKEIYAIYKPTGIKMARKDMSSLF